MTLLRTLYARRGVFLFVWAFEATASVLVGAFAARSLGRPLATHPDGLESLFAAGSRGLADYAREFGGYFAMPVLLTFAALAVYWLLSLVLAGSLPAALASREPVAARAAIQRAATRWAAQVGVSVLSVGGYLLAFLAWWLAHDAHERRSQAAADPRVALLWILLGLTVPAAISAATALVSDLARAHAVAAGASALESMRTAITLLWRRPVRWVSRYAAYLLLTAALWFAWWLLAPARLRPAPTLGLAALFVAHLALMLVRLGVRGAWLATVCEPYRTGESATFRQP